MLTGGGRVANPNTNSPANFGFNAKYQNSGAMHGSLTYVEHRAGTNVSLKSDTLVSLVIVGNPGDSRRHVILTGAMALWGFRLALAGHPLLDPAAMARG